VSLPPFSAAPPGSPETVPLPRMTASQEASFDAWIIKTYLGCWKPAAQPGDANRYVARVRLKFKPDGSLLKPPKLVNPPSDPTQKPQAKSVLQAVKACDPLPVPAEYRSFYEQWKTKTILFDPQVAAR
jgi:colicin import membrane protein